MLEYTKTAIKKTVDDFRRIDYARNVATQILYLAYLIYALFAGAGVWWANAILLTLSAAYFVFFMIVTRTDKNKLKKRVTLVFTQCKRFIKLITLGIMVYGICATTKHVTVPSVLFAAFLIVGWLLQIVFEVVFRFFINRAQFILEGIEADWEQLTKPAKTVGNFFKKLAGKEIEPEREKSKHRLWLDKKVAQNKAEAQEEKSERKRRKRQAKIDERNTRFIPAPVEQAVSDASAPEPEEVFEPLPSLPENERKR